MDPDELKQRLSKTRGLMRASNILWGSMGNVSLPTIRDLALSIIAIAGEEEVLHIESEVQDLDSTWSFSVVAYTSTTVVRTTTTMKSDGTHDPLKTDAFGRSKIRRIALEEFNLPGEDWSGPWPNEVKFTVDYGRMGHIRVGHTDYSAGERAAVLLPSILEDLRLKSNGS